jgi:hypothetical protein
MNINLGKNDLKTCFLLPLQLESLNSSHEEISGNHRWQAWPRAPISLGFGFFVLFCFLLHLPEDCFCP